MHNILTYEDNYKHTMYIIFSYLSFTLKLHLPTDYVMENDNSIKNLFLVLHPNIMKMITTIFRPPT